MMNNGVLQSLVALKAKARRGERAQEKAYGRWLGDFLDQDTPSGLLPKEEKLLYACAMGAACMDTMPAAEREALDRKLDVTPEVRVRAAFLRFLALGGDESAPIHEAGVELWDAFVDDTLDLRGSKCIGRICLIHCVVAGSITIEDASLGILYLSGGRALGLRGNRARIGGSVLMQDGFTLEGQIDLFGAQIGGSLICTGARVFCAGGSKERVAVGCTAVKISGEVRLDNFRTDGLVRFNNADVGTNFVCSGAKIDREGAENVVDALVCTGAKVRGDVLLDRAFAATGTVRFDNAQVGGKFDCESATFAASGGTALDCNGAEVAGSVRLGGASVAGDVNFSNAHVASDFWCADASASGTVNLYGVEIKGDLDCSGASFLNSQKTALVLTAAEITGSVFFTPGTARFKAEGTVNLIESKVGRDLIASGASIGNAEGAVLDVTSAKINGSIRLDQLWQPGAAAAGLRFEADGPVTLGAVEIGADLVCSGGRFTNPEATALDVHGADVKGSVYFDQRLYDSFAQRFEAEGTVVLSGARVGVHVFCGGGSFKAPLAQPRTAIDGDLLVVDGALMLTGPTSEQLARGPFAGFSSDGAVSFRLAQIGIQFDCRGGTLANRAPRAQGSGTAAYALDLSEASVGGLFLGMEDPGDSPPVTMHGSLSLGGTKARQLADFGFVGAAGPVERYFLQTVSDASGQELVCELTLEEFDYACLDASACATSKARRAWLLRQPKNDLGEDFRHHPFDHLSSVLRTMGHTVESRDIAVFKQRCLTRRALHRRHLGGVLAFVWRTLFDLFVRYGYRPVQGLAIALAFAMAAGWFYQQAEANGAMVEREQHVRSALQNEPRFHPYIYSLDVMLPGVKLGEADAWKPLTRAFAIRLPWGAQLAAGENLTQYLVWFETVFGWIAGGILLAVVSGLIKKD